MQVAQEFATTRYCDTCMQETNSNSKQAAQKREQILRLPSTTNRIKFFVSKSIRSFQTSEIKLKQVWIALKFLYLSIKWEQLEEIYIKAARF